MKLLLLLSLVGLSSAQATPAPTMWECLQGEFAADGYTTGQNIELNYAGTQMQLDTNGDTEIRVGFLVPKVYTSQYDASAFSITFNRETPQSNPGVDPVIGQEVGTNDAACFANQIANMTQCTQGANAGVWTNDGAVGDSPCVDYMYMTLSWTTAITGQAFGNVEFVDDGTDTRVYLTATVETWRKFHQTTGTNYLGQMTGSQQKNFNAVDDSNTRTGTYFGDGGDLDVAFPALELNDWRYTLYQIPFYLKFPKTVVVQNEFTVGSPIAVLNGVVSQDVIAVNMNPASGLGAHGPQFAVLDVSVTTQVQYPYGIRGPSDAMAEMKAYVGNTAGASDAHADNIQFVKWDDPSTCGGNVPGQICEQTFTVRITPSPTAPCSVAGDYFMEFWASCVNGDIYGTNSCGIGQNIQSNDMNVKRQSTAYFTLGFKVHHQDFCPEVVDTVHVAVDLTAYHDEGFTVPISNNYNGISTDYSTNADVVYTNDIIYYEAVYRTGAQKAGAAASVVGTNNQGSPGGPGSTGSPNIIDYVRAVKIFTDVYLGLSAPNTPTGTWKTTGWKDNLSWQLGGSRVPGPGEDFDDAATTVTGERIVQVPSSQPANSATWKMILCEVAYIDPAVPIMTGVKPADCFSAPSDLAVDFMDFEQIKVSMSTTNTIEENEVAFRMRMDERVFPIGPDTDNSYVTVTVESEVYYIGNQHPSRRLLQAPSGRAAQRQRHSKSMQHKVHYKPKTLNVCTLDKKLSTTSINIEMDFGSNTSPDLNTVNTWALNLGAQMDKHILGSQYMADEKTSTFSVKDVKKCTDTGCKDLLSNGARRRLGKNLVFATVEVQSTAFNSAGELANLLQADIVSRQFGVKGAQIVSMSSKDCNVQATNTKLASGASSLAIFVSGLIALFAAAL